MNLFKKYKKEPKNELESERLILRTFRKSDAADVYEYSKSENVGVNAGWQPHKSIYESLQVIDSIFMKEKNVWAIVLKKSNKLIGSVGLMADFKRQNPRVVMLGYSIGENYWGNGYMTEAVDVVLKYCFDTMDVDLVSAYCYPANIRSKRVLKKTGFVYESKLSQAEMNFNGDILDHECYFLSKEMYFSKK